MEFKSAYVFPTLRSNPYTVHCAQEVLPKTPVFVDENLNNSTTTAQPKPGKCPRLDVWGSWAM